MFSLSKFCKNNKRLYVLSAATEPQPFLQLRSASCDQNRWSRLGGCLSAAPCSPGWSAADPAERREDDDTATERPRPPPRTRGGEGMRGQRGRRPLREWINQLITPQGGHRHGTESDVTAPTLRRRGHWDVSSAATLDSGLMRKSSLCWISCTASNRKNKNIHDVREHHLMALTVIDPHSLSLTPTSSSLTFFAFFFFFAEVAVI